MPIPSHPALELMDQRSLAGQPFYFIIDFSGSRVELYSPEDLCTADISVTFPGELQDTATNVHSLAPKIFCTDAESLQNYAGGFHHVQENIIAGNSYLANYTRNTRIETGYTLAELYRYAKAKYKIRYKDEFVCFSPETFVEIIGEEISTQPMKGTIPADAPDAANSLLNNPKERAEHYTVVDLLRNDLSMVSAGVTVTDFQRLDRITARGKDLLGMSSRIAGTLRPEYRGKIGSIMQCLLPAGSILGAPKKKTMEIVTAAEGYRRGFYTGVCGFFDGTRLDSFVLIRFIEKDAAGQLWFKSGGGITHQSDVEAEYQEMLDKIYVPFP